MRSDLCRRQARGAGRTPSIRRSLHDSTSAGPLGLSSTGAAARAVRRKKVIVIEPKKKK
jgi:hypothetical protein